MKHVVVCAGIACALSVGCQPRSGQARREVPRVSPRPSAVLPAPASDATPQASAPGATEVLEVADRRVPCVGEGWHLCLRIRRPGGEWERYLGEIEGFDHEQGTEYTLRIAREHVPDPPADGSSEVWRLREVVSRRSVRSPLEVRPGVGVPGLALGTAGTEPDALGPYALDWSGGTLSRIAFRVADVGPIRVGARVVGADASLADVAALFANCAARANRGGTTHRCDGAEVSASGPTLADVRVAIVRASGR